MKEEIWLTEIFEAVSSKMSWALAYCISTAVCTISKDIGIN